MDTASATYRKNDGYVTRDIAGEKIIVPVRGHVADLDSIFTLNDVASVIWSHIDGQTTVDGIVEAVVKEFDVEPEKARADAVELLDLLEQEGLICTMGNAGEASKD